MEKKLANLKEWVDLIKSEARADIENIKNDLQNRPKTNVPFGAT